jgi:hypothetical protein
MNRVITWIGWVYCVLCLACVCVGKGIFGVVIKFVLFKCPLYMTIFGFRRFHLRLFIVEPLSGFAKLSKIATPDLEEVAQ